MPQIRGLVAYGLNLSFTASTGSAEPPFSSPIEALLSANGGSIVLYYAPPPMTYPTTLDS